MCVGALLTAAGGKMNGKVPGIAINHLVTLEGIPEPDHNSQGGRGMVGA